MECISHVHSDGSDAGSGKTEIPASPDRSQFPAQYSFLWPPSCWDFSEGPLMRLERNEGSFSIDASLLGELLNLPPFRIHSLMRQSEITGLCERGEGEHQGQYRLTFFYKGRSARLKVDETGEVIQRSIVDSGDRRLPFSMHKPRGP